MIDATMKGMEQLQKVLSDIPADISNKVLRPALTKASRVAVKAIKAEIPSRYKEVRKAIGFRVRKAKKKDKAVDAKVGAAVGKRSKSVKKQMGELERQYGRNRPGVGITSRNVHWWFIGTAERTQKTTKRRTGRMPSQSQPVSRIVAGVGSQIAEVITKEIAAGVQREAVQAAAKNKSR